MKKALEALALPGVEHDLNGETLILKGDEDITPEQLDKVKEAIKGLGFGCDSKSA